MHFIAVIDTDAFSNCCRIKKLQENMPNALMSLESVVPTLASGIVLLDTCAGTLGSSEGTARVSGSEPSVCVMHSRYRLVLRSRLHNQVKIESEKKGQECRVDALRPPDIIPILLIVLLCVAS
eukprot:4465260-Amphidinium_carterae.2